MLVNFTIPKCSSDVFFWLLQIHDLVWHFRLLYSIKALERICPHYTVEFYCLWWLFTFFQQSLFLYPTFATPNQKPNSTFSFSTDSFISIKFKENGVASWEKDTVSKVALENCNSMSWNHSFNKENKTVIEHGKPRASSLRWRKRIGHLFQLIRWKRTNKGNVRHVSSKVEGVKVRKGWIRNLTKKRTME